MKREQDQLLAIHNLVGADFLLGGAKEEATNDQSTSNSNSGALGFPTRPAGPPPGFPNGSQWSLGDEKDNVTNSSNNVESTKDREAQKAPSAVLSDRLLPEARNIGPAPAPVEQTSQDFFQPGKMPLGRGRGMVRLPNNIHSMANPSVPVANVSPMNINNRPGQQRPGQSGQQRNQGPGQQQQQANRGKGKKKQRSQGRQVLFYASSSAQPHQSTEERSPPRDDRDFQNDWRSPPTQQDNQYRNFQSRSPNVHNNNDQPKFQPRYHAKQQDEDKPPAPRQPQTPSFGMRQPKNCLRCGSPSHISDHCKSTFFF